MRELRPMFHEAEQFVERVLRQQKEGYRLAFLESEGEVCAVAAIGFSNRFFRESFSMSMTWSRVKATGRAVLAVCCSIG